MTVYCARMRKTLFLIKRLSLLFPPGQFCVKNNFA